MHGCSTRWRSAGTGPWTRPGQRCYARNRVRLQREPIRNALVCRTAVRAHAQERLMEAALEKSAMRKIYLRLLPFAIFTYFLAYIDRINVSFAGLTMRGDLDMSATAFGFAAGAFYWGYFIFEVPSNIIMEKVGARLWITRIMITWGIFAGLTAM